MYSLCIVYITKEITVVSVIPPEPGVNCEAEF